MKFNPNSIIHPISASAAALLLMTGLNNLAWAGNAAALKDPIKTSSKVAEAKVAAANETVSSAKATADEDFKKLDANNDGKVSLKEAVKDKTLASQFDATDVNHDGMISAEEYLSLRAVSAAKITETAPAATTN